MKTLEIKNKKQLIVTTICLGIFVATITYCFAILLEDVFFEGKKASLAGPIGGSLGFMCYFFISSLKRLDTKKKKKKANLKKSASEILIILFVNFKIRLSM